MSRIDDHRAVLRELPSEDWDGYLAANSGLPGPRGNLELMAAVAEEAAPTVIRRYATSDDEYLAACGAVGLGRLLAEGDPAAEGELRSLADHGRWRVREGVAMGLQRLGDVDGPQLRRIVRAWATADSLYVRRAAIAAVCEPRLLVDRETALTALDVVDRVTGSLVAVPAASRKGDDAFRVLRQALGYCWSVAVAACPDDGFSRMERWAADEDRDVRWVIRENLKKKRLARADPARYERLSRAVADRPALSVAGPPSGRVSAARTAGGG